MFERFTTEARAVVTQAQQHARTLRHHRIGTEHLLLGLLDLTDPTADVLRARGLTPESVTDAIVEHHGRRPDRLTRTDAEALRSIGIDLDEVRARLEENFGPTPFAVPADEPPRRRFGLRRRRHEPSEPERMPRGHIPFASRAKKVLELSLREALRLKHRHIGTEHILLGIIREGEGLAALILTGAGIDLGDLRREIDGQGRRAA
jgi:ATP-dependent Clp protease ATP-binding subunit ClpA